MCLFLFPFTVSFTLTAVFFFSSSYIVAFYLSAKSIRQHLKFLKDTGHTQQQINPGEDALKICPNPSGSLTPALILMCRVSGGNDQMCETLSFTVAA